MDTQMQGFWIEAIKKEASLRYGWHLKYSKAFAKQAALRNKQNEVSAGQKKAISDPLENISRHISRMEKELSKDDVDPSKDPELAAKRAEELKKEEEALLNFREMRSPSPKTKMQLYDGISHHQEGRYAYLKARNKKSPEDKYIFPVVSSTVYGWKIRDHGMPKSDYARTRVIRDTFYRHSGIITG